MSHQNPTHERFNVLHKSESGHCCFEATVLLDGEHFAECFDPVDAIVIAKLLNRLTVDELVELLATATIEVGRVEAEKAAQAEAERIRRAAEHEAWLSQLSEKQRATFDWLAAR